jgi:hypothetical protein
MAQPVMARNSLTHCSGPYMKKVRASSDSIVGRAGKATRKQTKARAKLCEE